MTMEEIQIPTALFYQLWIPQLIKQLPSPPQVCTRIPSAIKFIPKRCKDRPRDMELYGQPVALNGKVYVRGTSDETKTVLEYTPDHDHWFELPPPPVECFTLAVFKSQLLAVGGMDSSTWKKTNKILVFDENCGHWVHSFPGMPAALTFPTVVGWKEYLIIVSGRNAEGERVTNVSIFDASKDAWIIRVESLPHTEDYSYRSVLVEDNMYVIGQDTKTVLRAHVPTLVHVSGVKSGVWETVQNTPFYFTYPVTISNTLLTVGGSHTNTIQLFDSTKNQWGRVGELPEPMYDCVCCVISNQLYVFSPTLSVYAFNLFIDYEH